MFVGNVTGYNRFQNANINANNNSAAVLTALQNGTQAESTSNAVKTAKMDYFVSTRSVEAPQTFAAGEDARGVTAVSDPIFHEKVTEDTQTASWSATVDPSEVREGTTISINGVTFEFTSGENVTEGTNNIKVAIGADVSATAGNFENAVKANGNKIVTESGWVENFAPEIQKANDGIINEEPVDRTPVSCSWDTSTKQLTFTQNEVWAHKADKFDVKVGSARLTDMKYGVENGFSYLDNIKVSQIKSGDILKIGSSTFKINLDSSIGQDYKIESGKISIKSPNDTSVWKSAIRALNGNIGSDYTIFSYDNTDDPTALNITLLSSTSGSDLSLDIVHNPEISGTAETKVANIKSPAYLEYKVSYADLADGDNFNFKGVRFVFDKDSNTKTPEIKSGQNEKTTYITADKSPITVTRFQNRFNDLFAQRSPGGVGKSTGAMKSGLNNVFSSMLALINSGAYEMRVAFGDTDATVFIYSIKDIENITLEDGEGWKTADEVNENAETGESVEAGEAGTEEAEAEVVNESGDVPTEEAPVMLSVQSEQPEAVNLSSGQVRDTPVPVEAQVESVEPDKVSENTELADVKTEGTTDGDDGKKLVQDTTEKILENPKESVEAQASNLDSKVVVKLTADS